MVRVLAGDTGLAPLQPPFWTPSAFCHLRLGWRLRGELADSLGKQEQLERKEAFCVEGESVLFLRAASPCLLEWSELLLQ